RNVINWICVGVVAAGVVATSLDKLSDRTQAEAVAKMYPSGALAAVQARGLPARGFNSYNWGGYLIWNWYPEHAVFVGGRPEMYGDAFMDQYVRAYNGDPSWRRLFAANGLQYALVEPGTGIASALRGAPGWRVRYQDHEAVLFVATVPRTGPRQ